MIFEPGAMATQWADAIRTVTELTLLAGIVMCSLGAGVLRLALRPTRERGARE